MTLNELIDWLMVATGEFIVQDLENTLLDKKKVWLMVKRELGYYDKQRPLVKKSNIILTGLSPYTFIPDPNVKPALPGYNVPDWISSVIPANNPYVGNILFNQGMLGPRHIIWRYDKPQLYFQGFATDTLEVSACYRRPYDILNDPEGNIVDVIIEHIDEYSDTYFLELIKGRFLESLGMSRRAFTLADFPISMDASELVSEGREMVEKAHEAIEERNSWFLAMSR